MTIHLVYVKGEKKSTPYAITNELASRLALKYDVKVYDWADNLEIYPKEGDILIGHPNPDPKTVFTRNFHKDGWHKRILMNPFAHAYPRYIAYFDDLVTLSDNYLAICGKYWNDTISDSLVAHWKPWFIHLDLAVNTHNFRRVKESFNEAGKRRFLYIGRTADFKGCDFLAKLANENPNIHIGWIGGGKIDSDKIIAHGTRDFSQSSSLDLIKEYDFLLTCGRSDANPTTILESAAWGLIPVCTPQSGYYNEDWFVNIPLDDIEKSSEIIQHLNTVDASILIDFQRKSKIALENYYNWDRFARQVIECIESPKQIYSYQGLLNSFTVKKNRLFLKALYAKYRIHEFRSYWSSKVSSALKGFLEESFGTHLFFINLTKKKG